MSRLNIYRLSGVSNSNQNQQFNIWTADSDTLLNTRAANLVLARINLLLAKAKYAPSADLYNELDVMAIALTALARSQKNDDKLRKSGYVLQAMIDDGFFVEMSVSEDDRVRILEEEETIFETYYSTDTESLTGEFVDWWIDNIINNNYNDAEGAAARLREYERNKVGSFDPSGYKDLATYVAENGAYFLYYFIGEKNIGKYNSTIRKRFRKEVEMFDYICVQCRGVYTEDTVYDLLYTGCTEHYQMTPEAKIEQLRSMGRNYQSIGGFVAVITAISAIVGILATLFSLFSEIFTFVVRVPDDPEIGIPTTEEWDIAAARDTSSSQYALPILLIGAAALFLFTKKK